jgi:uncharacterized protein (DUF1697 family)
MKRKAKPATAAKKRVKSGGAARAANAAALPGAGRKRYVALLRGINLGPHKRMTMKDLVAVFEKHGCTDVATYIQSGNVVFSAPASMKVDAAELAAKIEKKFGFTAPVVVRTAEEIEAVIARNPYAGCDPEKDPLHVSFLAAEPGAEMVALLDPERSPGDTYKVMGGEIYMMIPSGGANTKLTSQYFDSRLKTIATSRNWRTVLAIREMLRGADGA